MSTTVIKNNTVTVTQEETKTVIVKQPGPKGDPGLITSNTGAIIGGDLSVSGEITASGKAKIAGELELGNGNIRSSNIFEFFKPLYLKIRISLFANSLI